MKILKKYLIIIGILFFGLLGATKADMIPENSHRFDRCVKIENIKHINGYKLIIRINTVNGYNEIYEAKENTCLQQHYKFGSSTPYLVNQNVDISYINNLFKNDQIDIPKIENKFGNDFIKFDAINPNGGFVSNSSRQTYENITYKLVQENNKFKLTMIERESDETGDGIIEYFGDNGKILSVKKQTNKTYFFKFFNSWLITILLETIALFFLCKLFYKKDNLKTGKIILTGILASSITLPILRFILPKFFHNYTTYAIFGEIFVTFVEVFIIKYLLDINRQKATIASIVCNLFSVIIGLLL